MPNWRDQPRGEGYTGGGAIYGPRPDLPAGSSGTQLGFVGTQQQAFNYVSWLSSNNAPPMLNSLDGRTTITLSDGAVVSGPSWLTKTWFKVNLWLACLFNGALDRYTELVAQSRYETANWTSSLYTEHNNAFGMRPAMQRPRTQLGSTPSGFATYRSVYQSCKDRILWDEANNIKGGPAYIDAVLAAGYVPLDERPNYRNQWRTLVEMGDNADGAKLPWWVLLLIAGMTVTVVVMLYRRYKRRKRK